MKGNDQIYFSHFYSWRGMLNLNMYVLLIKNAVVKLVKSISSKDTIIGFRNILYKLGSFLMDFKHNLKKVGCVIYQIVGIFMSISIMMLISLIDNDNCTKIYY